MGQAFTKPANCVRYKAMQKTKTTFITLVRLAVLLAIQAIIILPTDTYAGMTNMSGDHTDHISEIPMTSHNHDAVASQTDQHKCEHRTKKCLHTQSPISLIDEKCKMKCSLAKKCELKSIPPSATRTMTWDSQLHFIDSESSRIALNRDIRFLSDPFMKPKNPLYAPPEPPPPSTKTIS